MVRVYSKNGQGEAHDFDMSDFTGVRGIGDNTHVVVNEDSGQLSIWSEGNTGYMFMGETSVTPQHRGPGKFERFSSYMRSKVGACQILSALAETYLLSKSYELASNASQESHGTSSGLSEFPESESNTNISYMLPLGGAIAVDITAYAVCSRLGPGGGKGPGPNAPPEEGPKRAPADERTRVERRFTTGDAILTVGVLVLLGLAAAVVVLGLGLSGSGGMQPQGAGGFILMPGSEPTEA